MAGLSRAARPLTFAFGLVVGLWSANSEADDVDFRKYMTDPAVISAIATAVNYVGYCSQPLSWTESSDDYEASLSVVCSGGEDEDFAVTIIFRKNGEQLMPLRYEYAG